MKDLVEYILKSITKKPDAVKVTETTDETGQQVITISVDPEDMGRVIGKSGKVIHAIRNLVRVAAIQKNLHVRVVLEETGAAPPEKESAEPEKPTKDTPSTDLTDDLLPEEGENQAPTDTSDSQA